ncbi:OPT oligopeptide transporter protein-domain-containing protein [Lactifluus volemus]|nr:OPT oligopeptide transporter protein-domain-containing protein [Lactifluus volemus]
MKNIGLQSAVCVNGSGVGLVFPPHLVFIGKIVGSVVALFSTVIVRQWALENIPDVCTPHQMSFFTCPNLNTYLNSSILWSGIGSKRFFSPGAIYYPITWSSLIAALLPVPFYYLALRKPQSYFHPLPHQLSTSRSQSLSNCHMGQPLAEQQSPL